MKVLWLHSHFLYSTGGTRFIFEKISRLKKNHEITVCVEQISQEWIDLYKKIGISVHIISSRSSNSILYWLFYLIFYGRKEKH